MSSLAAALTGAMVVGSRPRVVSGPAEAIVGIRLYEIGVQVPPDIVWIGWHNVSKFPILVEFVEVFHVGSISLPVGSSGSIACVALDVVKEARYGHRQN